MICDDQTQLNKFLSIAKGDSPVEHIVTMDDLASSDPRVISLKALMAKGDSISDAELEARLDAVKSDDVALLIYTSGTTGLPKGAMLTHEGIDLIATAVAEVFPSLMQTKTRSVSYLPLCHAAEQGMTNFAGLIDSGRDLLLQRPHADQRLPGRCAPHDFPRGAAGLGEVRGCASGQVGRSHRHQGQAGELGSEDRARGVQAGGRDRPSGLELFAQSREQARRSRKSRRPSAWTSFKSRSVAPHRFRFRRSSSSRRSAFRFTRATE